MKLTNICPVAGALLLAGCISAPFQPPMGIISSTKAPLSTEGNWVVGSKTGTASSTSVLGLYATGDCSVATAAKNGDLKQVTNVDYEYTNILGIWQKATVVVHGE